METMLEIGPFSRGVDHVTWFDSKSWSDHKKVEEGIGPLEICDDARKRLMPGIDLTKTYDLRFYKKKPRCETIPILLCKKKPRWTEYTCTQWKEDQPNRRWKYLGGLSDTLTKHFNVTTEPVRLYVRAIEVKNA